MSIESGLMEVGEYFIELAIDGKAAFVEFAGDS
jgi:hypothetical protein